MRPTINLLSYAARPSIRAERMKAPQVLFSQRALLLKGQTDALLDFHDPNPYRPRSTKARGRGSETHVRGMVGNAGLRRARDLEPIPLP